MTKYNFWENWKNKTKIEKRAIELILAFFAGGDGIVTKNLVFRFLFESKTMIIIDKSRFSSGGRTYLEFIGAKSRLSGT